MPDTIVRHSFDYGSLDQKTAQFVQQQTSEIKGLFKQTVENIIAIGQRLNQDKERLPHGQWLEWLAGEFSWAERTARNYMQVAQQFKTANFADMDIAASALYLLAAPSTAEEAREEAIARAQAGERITVTAARDLRNKYIPTKLVPEPEPGLGLLPELERQQSEPKPEAQEEQFQPRVQFPPQPATQYLPRVEPTPTTPSPTKRRRTREVKPLVVAPKRVQPGEWWKLGNDNYLYCGDPQSKEFQKLLPETISLSIAFPPTAHWQLDFLTSKALSSFALHTAYEEDQDLSLLRKTMEQFLQIYTDAGDTIVLSFLADTAILPLLEQLGCRFLCADPDTARCDEALTVWTTTGRSAEKMKTRQTGKKRLASPALGK